MLALCIAPLTLRLAPRALPPSRRCAALTLRASPNPELPPEDSSPEEPQAEESLDFSEDFAAGTAYGESIRARFLAPRIDDPGLPYADALVCVCGALFVSQWALSPAVPIWLKIPLPSWLAPLPLPAGVDWRGIPYVVPALSHGAALASCWLLGALAASAFEADAYMGTWREALARTWRAGAFAVGVLIFGTQLSLYVSLSAQGLDPYTIPSAEALDLGAKADTQILSTAFELICDATVQAVGLTLFRLYRWRDAQGQGPPPR